MPENPAPASVPAAATPYHRMATLRPAWARRSTPLVTLAAAFIAYVVLISVVLVLTILVLAVVPGVNIAMGVTSGDPTSPLDATLALAMGTMWLPAGVVGVRFGGWRPLGTAWSITARLRSELRGAYGLWGAGMALIVVATAALVGGIVGSDGAASSEVLAPGAPAGQLALLALILLVLVPLQAAGLELALRGVVMQALGTWLRSPLLPILGASALMLIGRELTAAVVLPALALGLAAAAMAWKSGGLELPIVLTATITLASHLVSAFGAGTGAGAGAAALNAGAAAPGTSSAALAAHTAQAAEAALAGGIGSAAALLLITAGTVAWISAREGVRLLEPVSRPTGRPAPAPIPH